MKFLWIFILAVVIAAITVVYLDNKNKTQVYEFCQAQYFGASQKAINKNAEDIGLVITESNKSRILVIKESLWSFYATYACEILMVDDKITQRNFMTL